MKILCLYNNECALELFRWLKSQGHDIILKNDEIENQWLEEETFDLAISYTYSFIVKEDVIDALHGNIINLHTSYLPFDRGSSPNLFNIIEGSPRGVTIHYMDKGLDTGAIIAQKLVPLDKKGTLKSSYDQLDMEIKNLFKAIFPYYSFWNGMKKRCEGSGSYHKEKELDPVKNSFEKWDWNMPIQEFVEAYHKLNHNVK